MEALMKRVYQHIRVEEDRARAKAKSSTTTMPDKKTTAKINTVEQPSQNRRGRRANREDPEKKNLRIRTAITTVFNKPIYQILSKIRDEPFVRRLAKLGEAQRGYDERSRCTFYDEKGHLIENCTPLRQGVSGCWTPGPLWYAYAKTTAEKEAWRVAEESGIDLVVVNPSFVVGPLLAPKPTSTLQFILDTVKGLKGEYSNLTIGFVHIDDVIAAHILAMEESKASGRLICSSSVAHWSEIIDMLRAKYPSYPFEDKCNNQKGNNNPHSMNSNKIIQLGLPPLKTIDQMFDDCIKSFQDKGFLHTKE
ncbi:tetraketide alpha-pyrone reductase 2-like [Camellia sinensis]|uniref:tetraketide alpha-pyrone reductase 2-like n=1 Tax=Camellia sinensis TaxID=4442 RepID=UPI00103672B5|nr:tetraketide alpha-pyrone reductase 2-like [Camellia sinensis]